MLAKKGIWGILTILLVLSLWIGCAELSGSNEEPEDDVTVFSYEVDVIFPGFFNSASHTVTMNEWFYAKKIRQWWVEWSSYDAFIQSEETYLYKDAELKTAFSGSDMINDATVFYCNFPFNGEESGVITGTITLADIFSPPPKVWITCYQGDSDWGVEGKVYMREVTDTSATFDWSIPVYQWFNLNPPGQDNRFGLFVLPNGSNHGFDVPVSTTKNISDATTNVGSLGTESIKGVTLSGTINVTHNGEPVPYVEIWANYDVDSIIQDTCLFSPEPNAAWTMIVGSSNTERDITFQVCGFTKQNWAAGDMLFDTYVRDVTVYVSNQNQTGIVLDLGNQ